MAYSNSKTRLSLFRYTAISAALGAILLLPTTGVAGETGHGHSDNGDTGTPGGKPSRTIEVTMLDNYYEPETISVEHGKTIRFVVRNTGEFVHEFNIGTAAMHANHQEEMMMMVDHGVLEVDKINREAMKMKMPDGSTMEHDDPNSLLLEPGKSGEVVWTFSGDADLEFACNVPGHYDSGMMGQINHK